MQAIFRPNQTHELVISDQPATLGVLLEIYEQNLDNPKYPDDKKQLVCLYLSRSDARSIASAMMGAAAKQQ